MTNFIAKPYETVGSTAIIPVRRNVNSKKLAKKIIAANADKNVDGVCLLMNLPGMPITP